MDEKLLEEKLFLLDHLQSSCVGCGLCSEACATFQLSGWEHESPRGRIHLAAQFLHGRIHPQSPSLSTFDHCLGCQACEPLCPQQVPYHQVRKIVQDVRGKLQTHSSSSLEKTRYKHWITLAYRISHALWRQYLSKWIKIPTLNIQSNGSFTKKYRRPQKNQIVLAICCLQDLFQHDVIQQALTFMKRLGYALSIDKKQPCCGAIFERLVNGGKETVLYSEERQKAAALQARTRQQFLKWIPSKTYFLTKSCQCFIEERDQARDLYAWIEKILDKQQLTLAFSNPREIYYQPYCRCKDGSQDSIRRLLRKVKGLTIREMPHSLTCCGGYGGETLLHPQQAEELARHKLAFLPDHTTLILTSPDCWGQFKKHQGLKNLTILYPIQLLIQAEIQKKVPMDANPYPPHS